eukprot:TRINITY_DN17607_c0_g2_i3.p1 TRINITY_DN17607_c0_g2~~TRINITY_DN17607_c0_g2_i3.p1  ORF type:complete len:358 (+),score=86.77 TRINITY_DN17607_c0_g2_i3:63-1136(+)
MSELLDVFEKGGVDRETAVFLIDVLSNAEEHEWADILEPFIEPSEIVELLRASPCLLEKATVEMEYRDGLAAASVPNIDSRFLDILDLGHPSHVSSAAKPPKTAKRRGTHTEEKQQEDVVAMPGLLCCVDVHLLARLALLCRRARDAAAQDHVWQPRATAVCRLWSLQAKTTWASASWRERFRELLRPRCDGIYVSECRYLHNIQLGASMDPKLAYKRSHWVSYRRYLRLLPPDGSARQGVALVLRDTCSLAAAEKALLQVDPVTHVNEKEHDMDVREYGAAMANDHKIRSDESQAKLVKRVFVGTYSFDEETKRVFVTYDITGEQYSAVLDFSDDLDPEKRGNFSGRLEWAAADDN